MQKKDNKTSELNKKANTSSAAKSARGTSGSANKATAQDEKAINKNPSNTKTKSASTEAKKMTAAEVRHQEVVRSRIILGCILAAVVIVALLVLVLPKLSHNKTPKGTLVGVNDDVLQYTDAVRAKCQEYDISEYSTLLLALMQQESSGQGTDVFQCSESPYNTEYSNSPNSITDVNYSIEVGVHTFAYCLEAAQCKRINDTNALKLALQEYNFGNDYAGWALTNYGGYSEENAQEFSEKMMSELGWSSYGDPQYVQHVLQYINL